VILAFICIAWLLGLSAAAYTGGDPAATLAAIGALGAVTLALRPNATALLAVIAGAAVIALAGWRYDESISTVPPDAVQHFNDGEEVRFRAVIDDEPQPRATSIAYRLEVRSAWSNGRWHEASGAVLMTVPQFPEYEYGDLLDLRGELTTPPVLEDFDYRAYLAQQGIGSLAEYPSVRVVAHDQGNLTKSTIIDLRSDLSTSLQQALPEPEASLSAGILLGARSALPRELRDDMDATGTSHLVAVSGQNITLLAAAVIAAFAWLLGRRSACWLALAAVLAYAAFVGAEASVIRAAIMGAVFILSIAFGRQNSGWVALLLAATIMTALDPQIVHDISFQLSFAAVLGLVLLANPLRERMDAALDNAPSIRDFPITRPASELLAMSIASILFTLPITAVNFHQVSIVAPVTNLLVVPAFGAVAATSALVAVAGLASPDLADLLAWLAYPPAAYMVSTIEAFANLPAASVAVTGVSTPFAIVYYAALSAAVLWTRRPVFRIPEPPTAPQTVRGGLSVAGLALVLGLTSVLIWLVASSSNSDRLSVTVLDVGQGDAILVETPSGNRVLVDGGPGEALLKSALGRHLPFHDRRIDLVALSHPQSDHVGGLPAVLEDYEVGTVLRTSQAPESGVGRAWQTLLASTNSEVLEATRGRSVDLGDGVRLTVIHPSSFTTGTLNDSSLVLRLTYGDFSMLLTGDLGADGEASLRRSGTDLESTVLKVGHHGSRSSTSAEFLAAVDSSVAVISVGGDNRFGHPAPETVERLSEIPSYRTDEDGDITISTDGTSVWVDTQR
jgi:competence protein ComEC